MRRRKKIPRRQAKYAAKIPAPRKPMTGRTVTLKAFRYKTTARR